MSQYQKLTSYNKYSDIPTAAKTNYQERTPSRSYQNQIPTRYSLMFDEAKGTIGSLIGEVSVKKSINSEGIRKVHSTNQQALDYLNQNVDFDHQRFSQPTNSYFSATPKRNQSTNYSGSTQWQGRENLSSPHHDYHHQVSPSQFFIQHNGNLVTYNDQYEEQITNNGQNKQLRKALGQQILQNEQLMKRIAVLQENKRNKEVSSRVPIQILKELESLKLENQILRQETVDLLKQKKILY